MPKRILLLTFFYPPDLSAGSFRAEALIKALRNHADVGMQIDVLTTQPNRYHSHASEAPEVESLDGVRIRRIPLPGHQSGFVDQAKAFTAFALQAVKLTQAEHYDLVIATSSRLMTAVLGTWVTQRQKAKLYLDLRDIFVENLGELFRPLISRPLRLVFGLLEQWAVCRANKVNLVTPGFLGYFQPKYPKQQFSLYTNGVDDDFVTSLPAITPCHHADPIRVLYAGNIGDGQGLHLILPALAARLAGKVHFQVVGAGGRLRLLQEALKFGNVDNVELIAPVPRVRLMEMYKQADVLFLHLNDFEAFRRVLPSKLFEYAATGRPIWAGVAGYAATFIDEEVSNAAVFAPCQVDEAIQAFGRLAIESTTRTTFIERYARRRIMDAMARDVLALSEDGV